MTDIDKTVGELPPFPEPEHDYITKPGFTADQMRAYAQEAIRAALAQDAEPVGEVVITQDESGAILAVTRQDDDGRILSVIAEAAPKKQNAGPIAASGEDKAVYDSIAENYFKDADQSARIAELERKNAELWQRLQETSKDHVDFVLGAHSVVCTERDDIRHKLSDFEGALRITNETVDELHSIIQKRDAHIAEQKRLLRQFRADKDELKSESDELRRQLAEARALMIHSVVECFSAAEAEGLEAAIQPGLGNAPGGSDGRIAELESKNAELQQELDEWRFTNKVDELDRRLERTSAERDDLRRQLAEARTILRRCARAMDLVRDAIQPITVAQMKLHQLDPATATNLDNAAHAAIAWLSAPAPTEQREQDELIPCRCHDEISRKYCADKRQCSRTEAQQKGGA